MNVRYRARRERAVMSLMTQIGLLEKVQARALQSEIDAHHRPTPQLLLVTIELSGARLRAQEYA
jgi:hypothetical protein